MANAPAETRTLGEVVREILESGVLKPGEIVEVAKQKYGMKIGKPSISQIKFYWNKQKGNGTSPVKFRKILRRGRKPKSEGVAAPVSMPGKLSAVDATMLLCEKFGVETAKDIIAAFR